MLTLQSNVSRVGISWLHAVTQDPKFLACGDSTISCGRGVLCWILYIQAAHRRRERQRQREKTLSSVKESRARNGKQF